MADSEVVSPDKTKEKKKKKVGSTKEKEPRKKSGAESELQSDAKPLTDTEPPKATEGGSANAVPGAPEESAAASDSNRKSKKTKSASKSDEAPAPTNASGEGRKASVIEGTARKASTAEESSTPGAGTSRKASAVAPPAEESTTSESADKESEDHLRKLDPNELPPPIEGTYVVPPAATKKDIDLLQDLDENKLMELKEAFELFDYNQDGFIDYKDLKLTYQTLGYPDVPDDDIANMLAEAISPLDFDAFVILLGYKTIEMDPEAVLTEALACWDYDNSGLISEDRIKHDLVTWGDKFTPEEAEQALEDAPIYVSKKGVTMIDYMKFSNTLCGLRKKAKMAPDGLNDDLEFPVWGLLPKKETGVTSFLNKYPEYDGRGIVIAIFDSGVDPGAPGLQITSEGKPKVIDRFDCSGAGDVDTSTVVEAKDGIIQGLSGRKLRIPPTWQNPSGSYHIGIKNGFDLYPSKLKERIEKERKEKLWDPGHKRALAEATRKLQEFEAKISSPLSNEDKLIKEDLEAQVDVLNTMEKKYFDVGPAYDCVVFHDGHMWKACVDTSEKGDLANCRVLGEYSKTQDFTVLTKSDQLSYSINVYNDGNTLEIVSMCSSHGTHVASIAAAYFPDCPEKNGAAPGAQIVSLTIGDNRLGSMETGTALVRAMIKIMERSGPNKIHVINMSYGEHAHFSSSGRIGTLMNEVIDKHGVVWVGSAGNHGPALCTIGTPPDISTNSIIGVGAYVSPDMMIAEYSLRQKLPGMPYTWTSRGPTIDGDFGVTVCAPGGAITSVPNFTLRNSQLMNGTSMAAPHVCGAIALLLSGLEKQHLKYSPYSVKRALENTALYLDSIDCFAQGHGLLQVEKAFEHLTQYHNQPERDVRLHVSCGVSNSKGIHLRGGLQDRPKDYTVNVEPFFADADNMDASKKIDFGMKLVLSCNESWVQYPSHLDLMNMARIFTVRVDPTGLPHGVHFTSIKAFDVGCVTKGPVFQVPITVVRPVEIPRDKFVPELTFPDVLFKPNTINRHFILVPDDATWAVLRLHCKDKDKSGRFVLHTLQLRPKMVCKTVECHKMLNVTAQADVVQGFSVKGGLVLEMVVAKYWANIGEVVVDYTLAFHGVRPEGSSVTMQGADGIMSIELRSGLRCEEIAPVITLKNTVQVLRPSDSKISPLTSRDVIPPARQIYELQLTYNFHIAKSTDVTPMNPWLSDLLYESEYESQLWMLFDANKQLIASGDAYPCKYVVKLDKGDYVIKMHVRHEKKELLDKLTDQPMLLSQKLPNSLSLDVYASQTQATTGGKKMVGATLPPGHILPFYIAPLANDKIGKGISVGQFLSGTITYAKDEIGKKVDTYPFKYVIPEPPKRTNKSPESKDKEKTKWDEYNEAVRDLKTSWLAKLEAGDQATALYEELSTAYPDHLPAHTAMLQCLDSSEHKTNLPLLEMVEDMDSALAKTYNKIISVADTVINSVNQTVLLAYFGIKSDNRPDAAKIRSSMERQKQALVEALAKKGCALCRIYNKKESGDGPKALESIDMVWREVLKFVDATDSKAIYFSMWHATLNRHYGRALKMLLKLGEDKPSKELDEKITEIARKLGWTHWVYYFESALPVIYCRNN
ncbi:Tripeptidyl-peptidase 2 [Gryllus bimaculatus]|nr:Tripeptidyl-peptidase 2 [Gryllus bimaculatus]